jgi:transcriptional regulator with XRE-family HTH domain
MTNKSLEEKQFLNELNLLSKHSFKDAFNIFVNTRFDGELEEFSKKSGISVDTAEKWRTGESIPGLKNFEKLLALNINEKMKLELTSALMTELLINSKNYIKLNNGRIISQPLEKYLELGSFSKNDKQLWAQKFRDLRKGTSSSEEKRNLEFMFTAYTEQNLNGNFSGFIVYLKDKWNASFEMMSNITGADKSTLNRFIKAHNEGKGNETTPNTEVVDNLLKNTAIGRGTIGGFRQTFYQFARGAGLESNLADVQKEYAEKIKIAKPEEIRPLQKELYAKCTEFYGYTKLQVSQLSEIPISRIERYSNKDKKEFVTTKTTEDVENAYRLGKAFSQTDKALANNLAANFLGFPAYKNKEQIKNDFISGTTNLVQLVKETMLFTARKNTIDFSHSIGISRSETLNCFLKGSTKMLGFDFLAEMANVHLGINTKEGMLEFRDAVHRYMTETTAKSCSYINAEIDYRGKISTERKKPLNNIHYIRQ